MYIQAATKVFGHWAAEIAQRWEDDDLQEVKGLVEFIMTRVSDFIGSPHIEVQERVRYPTRSADTSQNAFNLRKSFHRQQTRFNYLRSSMPT